MLRDNKNVIPSDRLRHDIAGGLSRWMQRLSEIVRVSLRNFAFLIVHLTQYSGSKVFSHCFGIMLFALVATQAQAVTNISGTIATDTTWDVAGSPYVLTGRFL